MPRPSEPSPQPLPSDRLRVGECLVDIPLREVQAPSARRPRRITPKTMSVLLTLVDNAGRVVSRDALLSEVWPDTLPTNDVVTQAITQLRKAFGEERGGEPGHPHYIETIAKSGYRLLAPVAWLQPGEAAEAASGQGQDDPRWSQPTHTTAQPPALAGTDPGDPQAPVRWPEAPRARGRWRLIGGTVAGVTLLVALVLGWSWLRARQPTPEVATVSDARALRSERPYRLITSLPGFELAPTLSPDAAMVAYVAIPQGQQATAILVQTTEQTQPRQLTRPPGGTEDSAPAWSPDGRWIAFARLIPGRSCAVYVIAPNAGAEREVGRCDHRTPPTFDWTADGSGLIFGSMATDGGTAGLRVLDLASGEWQRVSYPSSPNDFDAAPRYSPDGRWIVFVRNPPLGDFWRIPAQGGQAQRLSRLRADVRGWDWLPDGRGLLFGSMVDGDTRMLQLDIASGQARAIGIDDVQSPTVAKTRAAAAFVQRKPYFGLYRVVLTAPARGAAPAIEPLFPSSARDVLPTIAPDARQLVFVSDRSGTPGLWWADLDQPDSLRMVAGVRPITRYAPAWSVDSRRLLVIGSDPAGRTVMHEVTPANGQVARLAVPVPEPLQGAYLPDPDRLLVLAGIGDGRLRLHLFDRGPRPWRLLATIDDVSHVQVDAGVRRVLFTRLTQRGLWQADLMLFAASVRRIDNEEPVAENYRLWAAGPNGQVSYLERRLGCAASLRRIGPADAPAAALCLDPSRRSASNGFSLSSRGDVIYLALADWDGADIGFMELPEAPETAVPGWFN